MGGPERDLTGLQLAGLRRLAAAGVPLLQRQIFPGKSDATQKAKRLIELGLIRESRKVYGADGKLHPVYVLTEAGKKIIVERGLRQTV